MRAPLSIGIEFHLPGCLLLSFFESFKHFRFSCNRPQILPFELKLHLSPCCLSLLLELECTHFLVWFLAVYLVHHLVVHLLRSFLGVLDASQQPKYGYLFEVACHHELATTCIPLESQIHSEVWVMLPNLLLHCVANPPSFLRRLKLFW